MTIVRRTSSKRWSIVETKNRCILTNGYRFFKSADVENFLHSQAYADLKNPAKPQIETEVAPVIVPPVIVAPVVSSDTTPVSPENNVDQVSQNFSRNVAIPADYPEGSAEKATAAWSAGAHSAAPGRCRASHRP